MRVKDVVDDIAAELADKHSIDLDMEHRPKLSQLCLQRDESAEESGNEQARA